MSYKICFSEGKKYRKDKYPFLFAEDEKPEHLKVDGGYFFWKMTGITIWDNVLLIVFPKNYNVPTTDTDIKTETKILLKTLLRYRNEKNIEEAEKKLLFGNDVNNNSRISTGLYILEDYLNYGILRRNHEIITSGISGRTNWPRTINTKIPVMSNGRPVYVDPVIVSHEIDQTNAVARIHRYILHDCFNLWGWLLDLVNEFPDEEIPYSSEEAIDILRAELSLTYLERETRIIQALINYLEGMSGSNDGVRFETLCTPYFHNVWESICKYVFDDEYERLKAYVPQPGWHSDLFSYQPEQIPDILFTVDNVFYVLDAKYYNYKRNMPGWHDIVKQYFYRLSVMHNKSIGNRLAHITRYENAFILPGNTDDIENLGYVSVDGVDVFGKVNAYTINTKKSMKAYAYNEPLDYKEQLLQIMSDVEKEI